MNDAQLEVIRNAIRLQEYHLSLLRSAWESASKKNRSKILFEMIEEAQFRLDALKEGVPPA